MRLNIQLLILIVILTLSCAYANIKERQSLAKLLQGILYNEPNGYVKFNREPWAIRSVRKPVYKPQPTTPYPDAALQADYDDDENILPTTKSPVFVRSTTIAPPTTSAPTTISMTTANYNSRSKNYNGGYTNINSMPIYSNNNYNSPPFVQPGFPESQPPRRYNDPLPVYIPKIEQPYQPQPQPQPTTISYAPDNNLDPDYYYYDITTTTTAKSTTTTTGAVSSSTTAATTTAEMEIDIDLHQLTCKRKQVVQYMQYNSMKQCHTKFGKNCCEKYSKRNMDTNTNSVAPY